METGPLMAGVGVGSLHLASLLGRLLSAKIQGWMGERKILVFSALLAAAGIATAVATRRVAVAMPGILLVGFAIGPRCANVPVPGRSGGARSIRASFWAGHGYRLRLLHPQPCPCRCIGDRGLRPRWIRLVDLDRIDDGDSSRGTLAAPEFPSSGGQQGSGYREVRDAMRPCS